MTIDYNKKSTENSKNTDNVSDVTKKGAKILGKLTGQLVKNEADKLGESLVEDALASFQQFLYNNLDNGLLKIYRASTTLLQMAIFGEVKNSRRNLPDGKPSYLRTNYSSNSTTTKVTGKPSTSITQLQPTTRIKSPWDFDRIMFDNRETAQSYLDELREGIAMYDEVSVSSFYQLVGHPVTGNYTLKEYGWRDLSDADVQRITDGYYILDLPNPIKL